MLYMLLPARSADRGAAMAMPGMSGTSAAGNPALALVLALFMVGYILWTTDHLAALSRVSGPSGGQALAPRLAASYKIVMSIAMGYMLLTMVA